MNFLLGKHLIRYDYQDAFPIVDSTKYPHRILDCGEDAFVTFHDPLSKLSLLAVADGVGGWADRGVDSSVCAWLLMKKALFFFQQDLNFKRKKQSEEEEDQEHPNSATKKRGNEGQGYILNAAYPRTLLNRAYAEIVTETGNKVIGSATVCLGVIDHSKDRLYTVNIGDSGFLLYRPRSRHEAKESSNSCNGNMIIKSQEQQHAFNFPYQLSPHLGYCLEADLPSSGMLYEVDLLPDDILFFASDGIFDNLYDSDLCHFFDDAHQQLVAEGEKGSRKDSMSDSVREPLSEHVQKGQRQHILRLVQSAILKGQDIR